MRTVRLALAAGLAAALALAAGEVQALTARQLAALLKGDGPPIVIDVRGPKEFAQGHIPGALNIPLGILSDRPLPPLGRVVVCGDGLGSAAVAEAVRLLNAKPGVVAEPLEGGLPAWQALGLADTRTPGAADERLRQVTYAELEAIAQDPEVTLVDLRAGQGSRTDLAALFPALALVRIEAVAGEGGFRALAAAGRRGDRLLVLIDDGDGRAEETARRLRAAGVGRLAVLAGGEQGLATRGRSGKRTIETGVDR